ncbi:fasciclin domain-containing protein [Methanocella sp. MCL-LM]|uniref:fasciclin domain-containing protein n=1 Tax=Methanocella sp. MCL-LM TaxID=3412035 RepID=UPI003C729770
MLKTRKIVAILALAAILLAFTAPVAAQGANIPVEKTNKDMSSTLSGLNDVSMANTIIKSADLDKTLATEDHTLFIPSDSAMNRMGLDMSSVYGFMTDKGMATKTMRSMVMEGSIMPSDMTTGKALTMINGQTMFITTSNGQTALDSVKITRGYQTTDGMIYVLDSVPSSVLMNIKSTLGL